MATVLRKNNAWLHGLIKRHLAEVVPSLCSSGIIPEEAKEAALREDVDASTRATDLLKVIEKKMKRDDIDPCTFGIKFIKVLIDSGIDKLGNLVKTEDEFRDEQKKASQRSSNASGTGSLNSSSSSVFTDDKHRGSEDSGKLSSRNSLERRASDPFITSRSDSKSSVYVHQRSKSVSHTQSYNYSDEKCFEEGHTLTEEQVGDLNSPVTVSHLPAFILPSITENPNSPDIVKRFTSQAPSVEHSFSSLPPQSGSIDEGAVGTTAPDDEFEFSQHFITEESAIMQEFVHSAYDAKDEGVVQENYERMEKFYQRMMQQAEFAHHKEKVELQATIDGYKRHCEEVEQKAMEKDHQLKHMNERLDERSSQLAEKEQKVYELKNERLAERSQLVEKEQKVYELKKEKKVAEEECERLTRQLTIKQKQIAMLNRNIKQRELEIELLKTDQLLQSDVTGSERNNKTIVRNKMELWKEMKLLVDDLFKKSDNDVIPVKLLIVDKVNLIKTAGRRRPSTSHN